MTSKIGRCLRRALDHKVRKLRSMLTTDEDIATELDRVVCRLMKLALKTSRGRQNPPPTKWMQCKLFDLLSLTEKAIDRRRKRFIENFPLNALDYDDQTRSVDVTLALAKIEKNDSVNMLVNKYQHLVQSYETREENRNNSGFDEFDFDENLSDTSNELLQDYEFVKDVEHKQSDVIIEPIPKCTTHEYYTKGVDESKLQRIQAWIDEDVEVVSYPNHDTRLISSGDTDQSATNIRYKLKKMSRKRKIKMNIAEKNKSRNRKKIVQKMSIEIPPKIKPLENNKPYKSKAPKKSTGKKSSYCLLVKANMYKTASNSLANLRSKKMKDYLHSVKPIPVAFKELGHPDLSSKKKNEENIDYLINIDRTIDPVIEKDTNVAVTEESLLVTIVTADMEETIALKRTIGTDAEEDPTEFEQETVLESLLSVMRNDSFCNKTDLVTEGVHSQTIFLNDINEPSTSKGVRHISMDVQCGPDVSAPCYSTLSATTFFTKIPKILNSAIKIGDSESELPVNNFDFGNCTGENDCHCRTISPRTKSVGIIIKDSDTNIHRKQTENFTSINDDKDDIVTKDNDTELVKPISSGLKMEDSGSEYLESIGSYPKSPMHFASTPGFISDTVLKTSGSKEGVLGPKYTCMKYVRPKLSRGGVHVHSYKDMQQSEDVLYQGNWQQSRPKAFAKKRVIFNTASMKKLSDLTKKLRVNSKEKIQIPEKKTTKLEMKTLNPVQVRMPINKITKSKDETKANKVPNKSLKITKNIGNVPKIPTKHPKSLLSTNKPKTVFVPRKQSSTLPPKIMNKELLNPSEAEAIKRQNMRSIIKKNLLNKSIESAEIASSKTKSKPLGQVAPLVRCKTEFIKKELLKFDDSPRDNISYVVLHNKPENRSNNRRSPSPTKIVRRSDSQNIRNLSPLSQNSSTSSPNSISTVRIVANRSKVADNKRISSSSNQDNFEAETATPPVRIKKFTKKNKIAKKADANNLDNKENIPQSSNGLKKEIEGKVKNAYLLSPRSVYIAQVASEPPLQNTLNSLSRHKTSTPIKLSIKSPNADDLILASPSIQGKSTKTSHLSSPRKSPVKISSQKVLTSQKSSTQLTARESESRFDTSYSHSLTTVSNDSSNNITKSFKKMIEERLDFIENSSDDLSSIDSKTVILSRENFANYALDESDSPESFRTVINNEDLDATLVLQNDLETAVNNTFDSVVDSTLNAVDDDALTDTDVLSFKTTTAASRASEYFLAENELNSPQTSFSKVHSVRDIFERRNQLIAQSEGGNLASQAFSGFSINAIAGDRPDPIAFLDSETGSLTLDTARQATSEEVFVSGRSSGSFESCHYDEDTMIPYWLFHINDQFADEEDEEEEEPDALPPLEFPEPAYDMNGNVVAAGAGAGDGRGMHSDHSQDSSGRGTSTTSSDPSSGAQSEAILIDPSAFTGQFELPAVVVTAEVPESSLHEAGENIGEIVVSGRRNPVVRLLATSDMDADVSSIDTDIQDSS